MKHKKWFYFVVLILVVSMVAGCGQTKDKNTDKPQPAIKNDPKIPAPEPFDGEPWRPGFVYEPDFKELVNAINEQRFKDAKDELDQNMSFHKDWFKRDLSIAVGEYAVDYAEYAMKIGDMQTAKEAIHFAFRYLDHLNDISRNTIEVVTGLANEFLEISEKRNAEIEALKLFVEGDRWMIDYILLHDELQKIDDEVYLALFTDDPENIGDTLYVILKINPELAEKVLQIVYENVVNEADLNKATKYFLESDKALGVSGVSKLDAVHPYLTLFDDQFAKLLEAKNHEETHEFVEHFKFRDGELFDNQRKEFAQILYRAIEEDLEEERVHRAVELRDMIPDQYKAYADRINGEIWHKADAMVDRLEQLLNDYEVEKAKILMQKIGPEHLYELQRQGESYESRVYSADPENLKFDSLLPNGIAEITGRNYAETTPGKAPVVIAVWHDPIVGVGNAIDIRWKHFNQFLGDSYYRFMVERNIFDEGCKNVDVIKTNLGTAGDNLVAFAHCEENTVLYVVYDAGEGMVSEYLTVPGRGDVTVSDNKIRVGGTTFVLDGTELKEAN